MHMTTTKTHRTLAFRGVSYVHRVFQLIVVLNKYINQNLCTTFDFNKRMNRKSFHFMRIPIYNTQYVYTFFSSSNSFLFGFGFVHIVVGVVVFSLISHIHSINSHAESLLFVCNCRYFIFFKSFVYFVIFFLACVRSGLKLFYSISTKQFH